MATFYDDPYAWIDDACESIERNDHKRAQSELMAAISIILLALVTGDDEDDAIPAAPIVYEDYPHGN